MVSRAACCLCRARAAARRAGRRLDQRRATAAATKQQARAAPEAPDSAAHSSSSTMISCGRPMPGATDEESARARAASKPGLDLPRIPRPPARKGREERSAASSPRGSALLLGSGPRPHARNGQGQARTRAGGPTASPSRPTTPAPEDVTSRSPPQQRTAKRTGSSDRLMGFADLINPCKQFRSIFPGDLPQVPTSPMLGAPRGTRREGPRKSRGEPTCCPFRFPNPGTPSLSPRALHVQTTHHLFCPATSCRLAFPESPFSSHGPSWIIHPESSERTPDPESGDPALFIGRGGVGVLHTQTKYSHPGMSHRTLCALSRPPTDLRGRRFYYPYFIAEVTEDRRGSMTSVGHTRG